MDVPTLYLINDTRKEEAFKKSTFGGYAKKDVFNVLFKKIEENIISEVCFWGVEIIVSGYFEELWERIILYYSKYINTCCPKFPFHLYNRLVNFLKIKQDEYFAKHHLDLRNSQEVRNHLCELLCIITNANKIKKPYNLTKITHREFSSEILNHKMKCRSIVDIKDLINKDDPKELIIIASEFAYSLSGYHYNINDALYWLSWLIEWEKINVLKKGRYEVSRREVSQGSFDKKYEKDFIWLFWFIILNESEKKFNEDLTNQIKSLFEFFKYKFTSSKKRKRIHIIINAIQLLEPGFNFSLEHSSIYEKYYIIVQACANINTLYSESKKEENLENSIINSRIKQAATFVVAKYEDIKYLNDISEQRQKTKEQRQREKEMKQIKKKKEMKEKLSQEERDKVRYDLINNIDDRILSASHLRPKKFSMDSTYTKPVSFNDQNSGKKTINVIQNIDAKLDKKKGKRGKKSNELKDLVSIKKI